jgi:hypothetical protein
MTRTKKNINDPSPLAKRICVCGCGHEFQPNRLDHIHLNSNHYDFAYNHGPRKEKYAEEKEVTKAIRNNDRVLEKYSRVFNKDAFQLNLLIVQANGFNEGMFTRVVELPVQRVMTRFQVLYKYCFRIIKQGDVNYIEIRKL